MAIVASLMACGNASTSTSTTKTDSTKVEAVTTSASNSEESTVEYKELSIKTDWEQKASITFTDDGMTIDGSGATNEDGVLYITEGGVYTLTGESSSCSVLINTDENVKLVLNGVTLSSTNGPVIYGAQVKNLYIELADGTTNTLSDSSTYATDSSTGEEIGKAVISCEDDLIILGNGTLNITANHKHGIASDDKLYVEGGTINITSEASDLIHANDLVCIDGGTITGTSVGEGIESEQLLYINGGTINVTASDDALNAGYYIEINDGDITVTSTNGDAIDCNGNYDGCITINGGTINATGAGVPEGALDADQASIVINGGTVVASGGTNSPVTQNGGDVDITGETNTGIGGGMGGGMGRGQKPDGEMPEGFDGQKPDGEMPSGPLEKNKN